MRFVPVDKLVPGMQLGKEIIRANRLPMVKKGLTLPAEAIADYKKDGYTGVYVVDKFSIDVKVVDIIPLEMYKAAFEAVEAADVVKIVTIAKEILAEIRGKSDLIIDPYYIRNISDYTYHHCVAVCIYSIAMGIKMKLLSRDLENLAVAALACDLGKTSISSAIWNKEGSLTDEEKAQVKEHSRKSADMVNKSDVTAQARIAVLMHHENEDGTGYPLGKDAESIPVIAKIIHVADVFDALIHNRSYMKASTPLRAYQYIEMHAGQLFSKDVVDALAQVANVYPPGIMVKLSNTKSALVLEHTADISRPRIKMVEDEAIIDLSKDQQYSNLKIVSYDDDYRGEPVKDYSVSGGSKAIESVKNDEIIIVDDSAVSLNQLKAALSNDYKVVGYENSLDVMTYVREKGFPALIIVNAEMPRVDGFTLIDTLIANGMEGVPYIFTAQTPDMDSVIRCKMMGGVDFIVKPVSPKYLQERVAFALSDK